MYRFRNDFNYYSTLTSFVTKWWWWWWWWLWW